MRFLVIAPSGDLCSQRVADMLGHDGAHEVLVLSDPLAGQVIFNWRLTTRESHWSLAIDGMSEVLSAASTQGIYARGYQGPLFQGNWVNDDRTYLFAEAQAALLAWLAAVECRVVNRPTASTWYRAQRPYPEWQPLLHRCGLPALATLVTNDLDLARDFARHHGGALTYTPMTSATRYPVQDDEGWEQLAKLIRVVPVCLIEQAQETGGSAWLVGEKVVWDLPQLDNRSRLRLEDGVLALAEHLALDTFEINYCRGMEGWRCSGINLRPNLEEYGREAQEEIVRRLSTLLQSAA
jgi:hypothetical protein